MMGRKGVPEGSGKDVLNLTKCPRSRLRSGCHKGASSANRTCRETSTCQDKSSVEGVNNPSQQTIPTLRAPLSTPVPTTPPAHQPPNMKARPACSGAKTSAGGDSPHSSRDMIQADKTAFLATTGTVEKVSLSRQTLTLSIGLEGCDDDQEIIDQTSDSSTAKGGLLSGMSAFVFFKQFRVPGIDHARRMAADRINTSNSGNEQALLPPVHTTVGNNQAQLKRFELQKFDKKRLHRRGLKRGHLRRVDCQLTALEHSNGACCRRVLFYE